MSEQAMIPKVVGSDCEFCNYVDGMDLPNGTGGVAARLLLREVDGPPEGKSYCGDTSGWQWTRQDGSPNDMPYPVTMYYSGGSVEPGGLGSSAGYNPQDSGRRYLVNGGCAYEDLHHLEVCIPEVRSAHDFVAATHAAYRFVGDVTKAANRKLSDDRRIVVIANNSDGRVSWGAHFNILTTRQAFADIVHRLYPYAYFLASYQASSMLFTGQGKVGADNGGMSVPFQISQRADFIETFSSERTTSRRPLINTRDEPLCGSNEAGFARVHMISFDHNMQQVANLLKAGVTQIIVAMIEAKQIPRHLILEDPVYAMQRWSADPDLHATVELMDGPRVNIVHHQLQLLEAAGQFVASGRCEGVVPGAERVLTAWQETLALLERRDWSELSQKLDWVLKRMIIERFINDRRSLRWDSDEVRILDLNYANLDADGLYFACADALENVVESATIERFVHHPPEDTRAWARAEGIRLADREGVVIQRMNWDSMEFRGRTSNAEAGRRVRFPVPFGHTRQEIQNGLGAIRDLDDLVNRIEGGTQTQVLGHRDTNLS